MKVSWVYGNIFPHDEGLSPVIFALRSPRRAGEGLHFLITKTVGQF